MNVNNKSDEVINPATEEKQDEIIVALESIAKSSDLTGIATAANQDTLNANIGAKTDTAATTDTGTFSLIALFKRLLQSITSIYTRLADGNQKAQTVDSAFVDDITRYKTAKLTVTLLHSPVAYAPGDVILGVQATILKWVDVAKAAGYGINIVGARIQTTDPTGMASKTFRLHVFNTTVDPIADNAAFSISDANTDKREGSFLVQMGSGTMAKVGLNYTENIFMQPVTKDVCLILETVEGLTPSAADLVISIYLKYIQGN